MLLTSIPRRLAIVVFTPGHRLRALRLRIDPVPAKLELIAGGRSINGEVAVDLLVAVGDVYGKRGERIAGGDVGDGVSGGSEDVGHLDAGGLGGGAG